jgi:hypothetical protein
MDVPTADLRAILRELADVLPTDPDRRPPYPQPDPTHPPSPCRPRRRRGCGAHPHRRDQRRQRPAPGFDHRDAPSDRPQRERTTTRIGPRDPHPPTHRRGPTCPDHPGRCAYTSTGGCRPTRSGRRLAAPCQFGRLTPDEVAVLPTAIQLNVTAITCGRLDARDRPRSSPVRPPSREIKTSRRRSCCWARPPCRAPMSPARRRTTTWTDRRVVHRTAAHAHRAKRRGPRRPPWPSARTAKTEISAKSRSRGTARSWSIR